MLKYLSKEKQINGYWLNTILIDNQFYRVMSDYEYTIIDFTRFYRSKINNPGG